MSASSSSFAAVAGIALVSLLSACRGEPGGGAPAPTDAAPPAPIASVVVPTASPDAGDDSCGPGPRRCAGPYTPLPEDGAPPPATSPPGASAAPSAEPPRRRVLGTLDDWVKAYQGMGEPERKRPPRLGVLADVPALPRSTLVLVRSGRLVRIDLPGGTETELTHGGASARWPRWTRDGKQLFFVSNRDGGVDKIFRMRADGTDATAMTKGLQTSSAFDWNVADDGAHIAYTIGHYSETDEVHLVDSTTRVDDVVFRGTQVDYPSFSRDGTQLFFVEGWFEPPRPGGEHPKVLRVANVATREVKTLPTPGVAEITAPWDLGDGRLLFVASADFSMAGRMPHLQTMPLGGGAWTQLGSITAPIGYLSPAPSPDGKQLAVGWSQREGGFGADWRSDITVTSAATPAQGIGVAADFPRPFYGAAGPTWAPDSRHLAFVLTLCPYVGCDIAIRSVVVVDTQARERRLAFVGYGSSPAFAPSTP